MAEPSSLADQAIARLRGFAKDNGLAPDSLRLLKANEAVYTLNGQIKLTPSFQIETSQIVGRIKNKSAKPFASFAELREEIARQRQAFQSGGDWIKKAMQEIEKAPGHGWGLDGSTISWPGQIKTLTATENCPSCRGTGQSPCVECQGLGTVPCAYCQGRGQELCPVCFGKGEDPTSPGKPCAHCNGQRFMPCRFCHGTGKTPCSLCQGKGHTLCPDCRGTGFLSQEARLTESAAVSFALGRTTDLPSRLLRTMDRLGVARLSNGLADISIVPAAAGPETPEDKTTVKLEARLPYADIRLDLNGETVVIGAFGKTGRLSGVPPFLDKATAPARQKLAQAAQGNGALENAMTVRLLREALQLVLSGKGAPNDLRRLYPAGLSAKAAQEIMTDIDKALRALTVKARAFAGTALFALSVLLFGWFFLGGGNSALNQSLGARWTRLIDVVIPVAAMGASWLALHHAARLVLRRTYPQAALSQTQNIGRLGYGVVLGIGAVYVLLFFLDSSGLAAALWR